MTGAAEVRAPSLVMLVHSRTVDLVSQSAAVALRGPLGLGDRLVGLRRDDGFVLGGTGEHPVSAWHEALGHRVDWANPNTQRYALLEAAPGVIEAARTEDGWPRPWLGRMLFSDRADLQRTLGWGEPGLWEWLAQPREAGAWSVVLAAWDRETGLGIVRGRHWPASASLLRLRLWTLALRAADADVALKMAETAAITRRRDRGLLVHPLTENWALVEGPHALTGSTRTS